MGKPKGNRRLSERQRAGRGEKPPPNRSRESAPTGMKRDIYAVALLAIAVGLFLALTTFTSLDGALIARGLSPANLVGRIGHWVAGGVFGVLGFAAIVLPIGMGVAAWKLFRDEPRRVTILSAAAYAALTFSLATLCQLLLTGHVTPSFPVGGAVGASLGTSAERLLGFWGSVLALGTTTTVALIVATDLKIQRVAAAFAGSARSLGGFAHDQLLGAVDEHRVAIAELRAEEAAERVRQAEELAASALVEGQSEEDCEEGRAVAGALALEQVRRTFDEPAWVGSLAASAFVDVDEEPEVVLETPRRRRKAKEEPKPEVDGALAQPNASAAAEALASPMIVPPLSLAKPEIVVSQAMLERGKRKKDGKKEAPSFTFTKAGDVFQLPSIDLLDAHEEKAKAVDENGLTRTAEVIVATLKQHGVDGRIGHIRPGPVVTLYEFSPVAGVKLAKIENLDKELTMALSTTRIRIIAPIPGKGVVGIEVPNKDRGTVFLRDILESESFGQASGFLPLGLGKDIEGVPYCVDLQKMPHLLIAGTTGSGKSVGLNTMILSMLYRQTPAEVRMIMVDPKMTELSPYEHIPHLLLPVVTDPQKAARALQWAVDEMERRTQILADTGSKDLKSYNQKAEKLRAEGKTFAERDDALPRRSS